MDLLHSTLNIILITFGIWCLIGISVTLIFVLIELKITFSESKDKKRKNYNR